MCTITKSQIELGVRWTCTKKRPTAPCRLVILFPPRLGENNKRDLIITYFQSPSPSFLRYLNCPAGSYRPLPNRLHTIMTITTQLEPARQNSHWCCPTSKMDCRRTMTQISLSFSIAQFEQGALRSIYIRRFTFFFHTLYCVSLRMSTTGWKFF